jgi:hypothetical protein
MKLLLRGTIYTYIERKNSMVFLLIQNVYFEYIFILGIFLCCILNTRLVVRFREALELVVVFEDTWKHNVFSKPGKKLFTSSANALKYICTKDNII